MHAFRSFYRCIVLHWLIFICGTSIIGINLVWSWDIMLLVCYWIQFASIFLRIFCTYILFPLLVISLSGFGIRLMLASIFLEEFEKDCCLIEFTSKAIWYWGFLIGIVFYYLYRFIRFSTSSWVNLCVLEMYPFYYII